MKQLLKNIIFLMAFLVLSGTGCTKAEVNENQDGKGGKLKKDKHAIEELGKTAGRYIEEDCSIGVKNIVAMEKQLDGSIVLVDGVTGELYRSEDEGQNFVLWRPELTRNLQEVMGDNFLIYSVALGKEGNFFLTYVSDYNSASGEGSDMKYIYVDKTKEIKEVKIQEEKDEDFLFGVFCILSDGKVLGARDTVYLINTDDGTYTSFLESGRDTDNYIIQMSEVNGLLYLKNNMSSDSLEIYNIETGGFERNEILQDFIHEEWFSPICEGEAEDSIYTAT